MLRLGDVTKPSSVRFDSQEDALNFARQCVEDSNRWLATYDLNFVKRYEKGELAIVIKFVVILVISQDEPNNAKLA